MVTEPPLPSFVVRVGIRTISPAEYDVVAIRAALGDVAEVLGSLLKLSSDEVTAEALRGEGNGASRGPTPIDAKSITHTTKMALEAVGCTELVVETLSDLKNELQEQSSAIRESFDKRSAEFTPRPVEQAAGYAATGAMLAGLLDATAAMDQLVRLLEVLDQ